jgi:uncharacterized protein YndB with AHSA1/START domain
MLFPESFEITTPTPCEILITRHFAAPPSLVFDAFNQPDLVRQWLLGPDGWTMPLCEIDLRVGGAYRYLWRKETTGAKMGLRGVFREIDAPRRLVATEQFDEAWYPGEALDTTLFLPIPEGTRIAVTVTYESPEARDRAARSGMDQGIAAGYNRLEKLLSTLL